MTLSHQDIQFGTAATISMRVQDAMALDVHFVTAPWAARRTMDLPQTSTRS